MIEYLIHLQFIQILIVGVAEVEVNFAILLRR